jgi:hypothetical protein
MEENEVLICVDCEQKMKCTYSVGVTHILTFRSYRCIQCGIYRDTAELPLGLFENLKHFDYLGLLKKLDGAQALKMRWMRLRSKKKAPTEASVRAISYST